MPDRVAHRMVDGYRCVAASLTGFVQQLAVSYFGNGYWFYVTGWVPERKDPRLVDEKLVRGYGVAVSKWARTRRKRQGFANLHYLRHGRFFVLAATHGRHVFFERETGSLRDARRTPVRHGGYAVSFRGGHPHVRIDQREYLRLKALCVELARRRRLDEVRGLLCSLPFEPYAPVRRQLLCLVRAASRASHTAGGPRLSYDLVRLRRAIVTVFEDGAGEEEVGDSQRSSTLA